MHGDGEVGRCCDKEEVSIGRTRHGELSGIDNHNRDSLTSVEPTKPDGGGARALSPNPAKRRRIRALGLGELAVGSSGEVLTEMLRA